MEKSVRPLLTQIAARYPNPTLAWNLLAKAWNHKNSNLRNKDGSLNQKFVSGESAAAILRKISGISAEIRYLELALDDSRSVVLSRGKLSPSHVRARGNLVPFW
ncbi:MAG: hypothetical protein Q7S86_05300 [bacterium]|nr:hypothetical protein [bacterium]